MIELERHILKFKKPARTSRGEYTERCVTLVKLLAADGTIIGVGECSPLPDLSIDRDAYNTLSDIRKIIDQDLTQYPALKFALESAKLTLLNSTPFARGEVGIPTNGLVWMSDEKQMLQEAESKISAGFDCIKFKIGALDWNLEMRLIHSIRRRYPSLQIRVDANGAFAPCDAMKKLRDLHTLHIHSIEQPIAAGQWEHMAELCRTSPVPIALDEELITLQNKRTLLETIRPSFIVVKPTLHGGISGALEWISEARRLSIGSWITSALESNVGLTSIAKLAAYAYGNTQMAQGLGTGMLFEKNIDTGIIMRGNKIWIQ